MTELQDNRSLGHQQNTRRSLTPREQLALTLLADEWSKAELKMCFETSSPLEHKTPLSEQSIKEIARFETDRILENADG